TSRPSGRSSRRRGRSAPAGSREPAGGTRYTSRPRSSARGRWPCSPTSRGTSRMQVILRQDVEKVGLRGEVVDVARGYARNYLLPRKLAEVATPARVAEIEKRVAQRARQEASTFEQAKELAATLEATVLRFDVKAGPT